MGAATNLAFDRLTIVTGVRRAWKHRVLPRDPAKATVFTPARYAGRE